MAAIPFALSVHHIITSVGAYAGFAAIVGLAILVLLFFAQARETASLRRRTEAAEELLERQGMYLEQRGRSMSAAPAAASAPATGAPLVAPAPAAARTAAHPPAPAPAPAPAAAHTAAHPAAAPAAASRLATRSPAPASAPAVAPSAPAGVGAPALHSATRLIPIAALDEPRSDRALGSSGNGEAVQARTGATAAASGSPPPSTGATAAVSASPPPSTAAAGNGSARPAAVAAGSLTPPAPAAAGVSPRSAGGAPGRPLPGARDLNGGDRGRPVRRFVAVAVAVLAVAAAIVVVLVVTSGSSGPSSAASAAHRSSASAGSHHRTKAAAKVSVTPSDVTVAVLNATATANLAHDVMAKLTGAGYKPGGTTNAPSGQTLQSTIVGYTQPAYRNDALAVAKSLNLGSASVQGVDQSDKAVACSTTPTNCPAQVVITVGADLASAA